MNKQLSIYLDLLRFTAALLVYLTHLPGRCGGYFWQFASYGREAVIFFFVLSGFVIAFVSDTKERDPKQYFLNRMARLYSVVLPALLLSYLCHVYINYHSPDVLAHLDIGSVTEVTVRALTFSNESWQHHEDQPE